MMKFKCVERVKDAFDGVSKNEVCNTIIRGVVLTVTTYVVSRAIIKCGSKLFGYLSLTPESDAEFDDEFEQEIGKSAEKVKDAAKDAKKGLADVAKDLTKED